MTLNPNKAPSTLTHEEKVGIQVIRELTDSPELHQAEIDSVYEYAHDLNAMGNRIERIENAAKAMGIDDHSWADPEEGIDGGAALVKLAERMHAAETYELSEDEKKFLQYEDSAMQVYEARASIDQAKLLEENPADSVDDALTAAITKDRDLRKQRKQQAEDGTLPEDFHGDINYFGGVIKREGVTLRYLQHNDKIDNYGNKLLDAIDAKAANPEDAAAIVALEEASENATKSEKVNKAVAKTFAEVAQQYPNEEYQVPAEATVEEEGDLVAAQGNGNAPARVQGKRAKKGKNGPGRQTRQSAAPDNSRRSSRRGNQPANDGDSNVNSSEQAGATAASRSSGRRAQNAAGSQPPAGPPRNPNSGRGNGNSENQPNPGETPEQQATREAHERTLAMLIAGQRRRVTNAAEFLATEGRRRSRFEGFGEGSEHEAFRAEVFELMKLEHPEFLNIGNVNANPDELKALNAHMNAYVAEKYNLVTKATVDGMGGEKDPKKRKRNARIIRLGASAAGLFLGGPAGAVVAGSIALGVTKALDHEFKGREKLANSINEYGVQQATDQYIDNLENVRAFDPMKAYEVATRNLREQYERGVVIGRNKRIGGAFLVGGAWGLGTYLGLHQAADVLSYGGGEFRHWFSTLDNPAGNPGYNYVPGDKPFSFSFLQAVFNNPMLTTLGVGTAAAAGAAVAKSRRTRSEASGSDDRPDNRNRRRPSNGSPRPLVNA